MTPFFSNPARIAQLAAVCETWLGTPFMPNAAIKHAGVSCQKLVGSIYIECGALAADFAIPEGPMDWSHAQTESLIEKFMKKHSRSADCPNPQRVDSGEALEFTEVSLMSAPLRVGTTRAPCQPGDMLGFRIGGCVHHCGVVFTADGKFVHCLRPDGVRFNNLHDATYWTRLEKIWRPIDTSRRRGDESPFSQSLLTSAPTS